MTTLTTLSESLPTLQEIQAEKARRSFLRFAQTVYPNFQAAPHHRAIIDALEAVEGGDIRRLILQVPPRHGKSTLASHLFPPWYLGRNPDKRVIACSYSVDLAFDLSRKARNTISGSAYGAIFPKVGLAPDARAVGQWELVNPLKLDDTGRPTPYAGGYVSAGVGGGIVGKGADCVPAGTLIATTAGPVPIEQLEKCPQSIKIGCYDQRSGEVQYESQEAFLKREAPGLYRVTTAAGRVVEATGDHPFWSGDGYTKASDLAPGDPVLCLVPQGLRAPGLRYDQGPQEELSGRLLLRGLRAGSPCDQEPPRVQDVPEARRQEDTGLLRRVPATSRGPRVAQARASSTPNHMPNVQSPLLSQVAGQDGKLLRDVLLQGMRGTWPLSTHGGQGQSEVEARCDAAASAAPLRQSVPPDAPAHSAARPSGLRHLQIGEGRARAPHRQLADEQRGVQPCHPVQQAPSTASRGVGCETVKDTVALVERLCSPSTVYDIQVAKHHNFFANGVLVHNCAIIDDPLKNPEEASSATVLESIWQWYTSALYTRLEGAGAIILIMTRWAEADLAGRVQQASRDEGGDTWEVVDLPAIAEAPDALGRKPGEALWPEKFSIAELERIKVVIGSEAFTSLYGQRPTKPGGNTFKREWWKRYRAFDRAQAQQVIQVWDTAFKAKERNDFSVCSTWALMPQGAYILDVFRHRIEFPELKRAAKDLYAQYRPVAVCVEDRASGQSLIQELKRETNIPVLAVPADTDKTARATAVTPIVEAGRVFLPEDAPWVHDWIEEHAQFPNGAYDDQVDTTSMALRRLFPSAITGNRVAVSGPRPQIPQYTGSRYRR